jgi:hypothetical protein
MWKSLFLALGAYTCLLGLEALIVEKAVVRIDNAGQPAWREVVPPEGAPWLLLGAGAIVMLYSFTLPQRLHGG